LTNSRAATSPGASVPPRASTSLKRVRHNTPRASSVRPARHEFHHLASEAGDRD
jgi:hypothetical protein